MRLYTKSIQKMKSKKDGIRICIMRRPGKFNDQHFDIWMPVLAPSHKLLDNIHKGNINWKQYVKRFEKQVLKKQKKYINFICNWAQKTDITLLCWEKSPKKCHRRLVAEECKKINPKLKVKIK